MTKMSKYPVVTLCGSTRFKDAFMEAQKRLTLEGNIVISVGLFGHSGDQEGKGLKILILVGKESNRHTGNHVSEPHKVRNYKYFQKRYLVIESGVYYPVRGYGLLKVTEPDQVNGHIDQYRNDVPVF